MSVNKNSLALGVAMVFFSCAAVAQTPGVIRPAYEEPVPRPDGSVQLGDSPFFLSPTATVAYGHDSNVTRANTGEVSSPYFTYSVGVKADARDEKSVFLLGLLATGGRYSDSSKDDYNDATMNAAYDMGFDVRNRLLLNWDYTLGHEARGATDRGSPSPDKYSVSKPGFTYVYGAPGAQGRMEVYASRAVKQYRSNEETTAISNHNSKEYGAILYWRMMPKTHFLVEARGTDVHYTSNDSSLSGSEARYFGGITWDATALTKGTVKIGRMERRFDSDISSFNGTSWEGTITWLPRSYSKFDLYSSRQTTESTGLGNFIVTDTSGINWTHAWNSYFSTVANATFVKDRYQGFDRNDDSTGFGLRAYYQFRRWMTLGAEYQHTTRDSNQKQWEYDRDIWLVTATLTM